MAGGGLLVAVVLATLGKILIEQGIEREDVAVFLEKVWNGTGETFGVPTGGPGGAGEAVMGMLGSARGAWDAVFAGL